MEKMPLESLDQVSHQLLKSRSGRQEDDMAMKYFCDGCDREIPEGSIHKLSVQVKKNGDVTASGGAYELCNGCASTLARDSNPRNWAGLRREGVGGPSDNQ